jgi:hypothetical protein
MCEKIAVMTAGNHQYLTTTLVLLYISHDLAARRVIKWAGRVKHIKNYDVRAMGQTKCTIFLLDCETNESK